MKQSLLKAAAVTSSVLLVSGFVCYRAGAFHWLKAQTTSMMSGTKSTFQTVGQSLGSPSNHSGTEPANSSPKEAPSPTAVPAPIMPGPKSGFVLPPETVPPPFLKPSNEPPAPPKKPIIMGGVKSEEIFSPNQPVPVQPGGGIEP